MRVFWQPKILATSDQELLQKLKDYKEELKNQVVAGDARLAGSWI